eukprot:gene94-57_t
MKLCWERRTVDVPRRAQWGPDGSTLLLTEETGLRVCPVNLSVESTKEADVEVSEDAAVEQRREEGTASSEARSMRVGAPRPLADEGEMVFDVAWVGGACFGETTTGPVASFATSSRGHPIHLWEDAEMRGAKDREEAPWSGATATTATVSTAKGSGQLMGTCTGLNLQYEVAHAYSLAATGSGNPLGSLLAAGYDSCIKVFDVSRLANSRQIADILTSSRRARSSGEAGCAVLKGIVGALDFRPVVASGSPGPPGSSGVVTSDAADSAGQSRCDEGGGSEDEAALRCGAEEADGRNSSCVLLAGTYQRQIGLYDVRTAMSTMGSTRSRVSPFVASCALDTHRLASSSPVVGEVINDDHEKLERVSMGGVTCLKWVDDIFFVSGHRKDTCLRVWDARNLTQPFCRLPRGSMRTNQRLTFSCGMGCAISGDDSGNVIWYDLAQSRVARVESLGENEVVVSAEWHPGGLPYVATSSGSFALRDVDREPHCDWELLCARKRRKISERQSLSTGPVAVDEDSDSSSDSDSVSGARKAAFQGRFQVWGVA